MEWVIAGIAAGLVFLLLTAWLLGFGTSSRARTRRAGGVEAAERASDGLAELWDWLRRGR